MPWPKTHPGYDPDQLPLPAGSVDAPATREWRARYAAAVTKADTELGLILEAVRAHLGTNTLLLFSSDHGARWPFAKWNCYEAGVKVPLIIVWPGVVKPNTRTAAMVSWVDYLPTLLEVAGGTPPRDLDGRSYPAGVGRQTAAPSPPDLYHAQRRRDLEHLSDSRRARWVLEIHPQPASRVRVHHPYGSGRRPGAARFLRRVGSGRANRCGGG
jgi:arylsulfatase A-like enzyme